MARTKSETELKIEADLDAAITEAMNQVIEPDVYFLGRVDIELPDTIDAPDEITNVELRSGLLNDYANDGIRVTSSDSAIQSERERVALKVLRGDNLTYSTTYQYTMGNLVTKLEDATRAWNRTLRTMKISGQFSDDEIAALSFVLEEVMSSISPYRQRWMYYSEQERLTQEAIWDERVGYVYEVVQKVHRNLKIVQGRALID